MSDPRQQRVQRLLEAGRKLADPAHPLGQRLRAQVATASGLAPESIEYALQHCLELAPSDAELQRLSEGVEPVARAWVSLSANVFTAALRAIAIALVSSADVRVRPSTRDPVFATLLHEAAPALFSLTPALEASPGDAVWAYGSDATMGELRAWLQAGVTLHAHGDGFGVVAVCENDFAHASNQLWLEFADAVALDAALFEGRGCLSPRLVLAEGSADFTQQLTRQLLAGFDRIARRIPRGLLGPEERADCSWYRECVRCIGSYAENASGAVARVCGIDPVPAPGRVLQVCAVRLDVNTVNSVAEKCTCLARPAHVEPDALGQMLRRALPGARHCHVGKMQQPPLDGPVDLRGGVRH